MSNTNLLENLITHSDHDTMANHILLPKIRNNGQHLRLCFCDPCRNSRYRDLFTSLTADQLYQLTFVQMARTEEIRLNNLLQGTLRMIVAGKAYKDLCLRNTHYHDFGWWLRSQPNYMGMDPKSRTKFCRLVNQIDSVYTGWDTIVSNLTDPRITHLDARRFSIDSFYRARNLDWCLNENELKRGRGDADIVYEEFKYQRILHYIITTGILVDIDHDAVLTSMLGRRLQRDLMQISAENR